MDRIPDSANTKVSHSHESTVESRIFRAMAAIVSIAVVGALIVAPWRVVTGLIVGGALSLVNFHWLRTSMMAMFNQSIPRIGVIRYILRYLMMALVIAIVYRLGLISLAATIAGLCSFVIAFFIEASRQSYFILTGREESC
jgi:ATP synthase I chain